MNGDEKATLSALIDGESDSLEERRFLRDHDPALAIETVQHWQLIGRVLRRDQGVDADLAAQQALFRRIQAEVAAEADELAVSEKKSFSLGRPWIYGLAASVLARSSWNPRAGPLCKALQCGSHPVSSAPGSCRRRRCQ